MRTKSTLMLMAILACALAFSPASHGVTIDLFDQVVTSIISDNPWYAPGTPDGYSSTQNAPDGSLTLLCNFTGFSGQDVLVADDLYGSLIPHGHVGGIYTTGARRLYGVWSLLPWVDSFAGWQYPDIYEYVPGPFGAIRLIYGYYGCAKGNFNVGEICVTNAAPVPEPSTLILLGSGLIGFAGWGRKKFCR